MNPMFNEYKDAGKIQEALLIGRNMVNKAPGDSECVNAYLDFLLMLAEKLPRTDERKSFADQANLVLSFYEENADLTDDIINDIHVYHNRLGAVVTDIAQLEQEEYEKQKRAIEATNTTQIKKLYARLYGYRSRFRSAGDRPGGPVADRGRGTVLPACDAVPQPDQPCQ